MGRFEELDKMVKDGIITRDAADDIKEKSMKKMLTDNNITMPTITEHMRKGRVQYTCMIPASQSRNGKRHQITGKTREECEKRWITEIYDVLESGKDRAPETIADLMLEWMSKKQDVKKQTLTGYYSHYDNHIKNSPFAKKKIKDVRLQDCKDIIAYLINKRDGAAAGMGYNTIRHIKSEISMAFDYAIANEYINANYMATVKINQGLCDTTRARKSKAWTDEELQELCSAALTSWEKKHMYRHSATLIAMIFTGCRAGEFCALEWDDFDETKRTLTINKTLTSYKNHETGIHTQALSTPKTPDSVRTIELTDEAVFWLKEIKRRQIESGIETTHICSSRNGLYANQRDLNVRFEVFCKANGIEYSPTHTARRTYASVLYDGGVPVSEIARDLGHKKITTTMNSYYKPRAMKNLTNQKNKVFVTAVTAGAKTLKTL